MDQKRFCSSNVHLNQDILLGTSCERAARTSLCRLYERTVHQSIYTYIYIYTLSPSALCLWASRKMVHTDSTVMLVRMASSHNVFSRASKYLVPGTYKKKKKDLSWHKQQTKNTHAGTLRKYLVPGLFYSVLMTHENKKHERTHARTHVVRKDLATVFVLQFWIYCTRKTKMSYIYICIYILYVLTTRTPQ